MTKITIDRATVEQALHVATAAGYPVALIAALNAALAEPVQEPDTDCHAQGICQRSGYGIGQKAEPVQEPVAWTPVAEALPNSGVKVLACYRNRLGNLRRIRAMWTAAKTEEADSDDAETCSEYDEATDTYYVTEGWYECIDNWGDYSSVAVTEGDVTHWMPLPPDPSTAPPQRLPLTEEEIESMWEADTTSAEDCQSLYYFKVVARAIERAHGIGGKDGQV
jgi:hypothetical protein